MIGAISPSSSLPSSRDTRHKHNAQRVCVDAPDLSANLLEISATARQMDNTVCVLPYTAIVVAHAVVINSTGGEKDDVTQ